MWDKKTSGWSWCWIHADVLIWNSFFFLLPGDRGISSVRGGGGFAVLLLRIGPCSCLSRAAFGRDQAEETSGDVWMYLVHNHDKFPPSAFVSATQNAASPHFIFQIKRPKIWERNKNNLKKNDVEMFWLLHLRPFSKNKLPPRKKINKKSNI